MAYNRNIPQPTDLISNSQPALLANFQAIDSGTTQSGIGFSRNHVTMTDASNGGLHNRIDFFQNIADPLIISWISSLYPNTTNSALNYRLGTTNFQLTNLPIVSTSGSGFVNYSVQTPWGIKLSWGLLSIVTGSAPFTGTATFAIPFAALQSLTVTAHNVNGVGVSTENESTTGFTAYCNSGNAARYFAIGT